MRANKLLNLNYTDVCIWGCSCNKFSFSKRRPVAVIKDTGDNDILIAKITSKLYSAEFDVSINEWHHAGLLSPSIIRVHKIQTLHIH